MTLLAPEEVRADVLLVRALERVAVATPPESARPDLGPCWLWTGSLQTTGYGLLQVREGGRHRNLSAHRLVYEELVGPIPEGLDLDHLCRVRRCVKVGHLEPVTRLENLLRGETIVARNAAKTHCDHGHPFDQDNTYWHAGARHCKTCRRAQSAAAARRRRERQRREREQ